MKRMIRVVLLAMIVLSALSLSGQFAYLTNAAFDAVGLRPVL
jgi:hypothetical protein